MPKARKVAPAFRVENLSEWPVKVQTKKAGALIGRGFIVGAGEDHIKKITAPFDELYFRSFVKNVSQFLKVEYGTLRGGIFEMTPE